MKVRFVIVCPSLYSNNSTPSAVLFRLKYHPSLYCSLIASIPRRSKWILLFSQLKRVEKCSWSWYPKRVFVVEDFYFLFWNRYRPFCMLPLPCFLSCFCLDCNVFLVFSYAKSWWYYLESFSLFRYCWKPAVIPVKCARSHFHLWFWVSTNSFNNSLSWAGGTSLTFPSSTLI